MKEYALLAFLSVLVTAVVDARLGVKVLLRKEFYFFLLFILFFKFMVNGYLTAAEVVIYSPRFYLGLRVGSIPLEDFFFGFSMVTLCIVFWEYFKARVR